MKMIIFVTAIVVLPTLFFRQPLSVGQVKPLGIPTFTTPTAEQTKARVLGAENDKRSLAINNDIAELANETVSNSKLKAEAAKYKKLVLSLTKEKEYYKQELANLKKRLIQAKNTQEFVLSDAGVSESEGNSYELKDSLQCKPDTVYIKKQKKGFFNKIFGW